MSMFNYTSKCCDARATKPALVKTPEHKGSLGTWTCSKCGKTCSCYRHKAKEENASNVG